MKNVLKNLLKMIVAGVFVVAIGFGMSTILSVSKKQSNINLSVLANEARAWGEDEDGGWFSWANYYCEECTCVAIYCEHTLLPNHCLPINC